MEVRSIKQFAEEQNVSYEAIRKQVARYADDLKGHIIRKNRTQYLDEWAMNFLKEKRRENPVILMNMDQNEQLAELKAQNELIKNELIATQKQLIAMQEDAQKSLETKIRYDLLLEEKEAQKRALDEAKEQIKNLTMERDSAQAEARSFEKSLFGFYRKKN